MISLFFFLFLYHIYVFLLLLLLYFLPSLPYPPIYTLYIVSLIIPHLVYLLQNSPTLLFFTHSHTIFVFLFF
ncbi:uncharacterized protein BX664DRAFT_274664 [Halteromyces radiatus]|uniref:uncharacterized protein n=1 Tax=Halteromyces radiatus TaxID=101107 RepID=UPI002220A174|nr:uncharacterized protein BX664DRAFT_274664 [Halteromyces radiatus]KAI8096556.1 hypothetical protein BX664DRAFT_274664 [Halteromyces radiatus]